MLERELTRDDMRYARGVVANLPASYGLSIEDAVGDGMVGLLKAARDYSDEFGVPFLAYARRRITGEVLDAARRNDYLGRRHRDRVNAGECEDPGAPRYLEELVGDAPDQRGGCWDSFLAAEDTHDIDLALVMGEVVNSIEGVPGAVLRLWAQDIRLREIGEMLGFSESRASQLLRRGREEVREALGAESPEELLAA